MNLGDICISHLGESLTLVSKTFDSTPVLVYNLEVENCHTYFVGNENCSILVHNDYDDDTYITKVGKTAKGMVWTGPKRLVWGVGVAVVTTVVHPIKTSEKVCEVVYNTSSTIYSTGQDLYNDPSGTALNLGYSAVSSIADTGNYLLDNPEEAGVAYFNLALGATGGKAIQSGLKAVEVVGVIKKYGPHMKGPLSPSIANTFRGGVYTERVLSEDLIVYRVYGGNVNKVGAWFTKTEPFGPLQAQMDLALNPEWGNAATNVTKVKIPKGTKIYEGFAEQQRIPVGGVLQGGGTQVHIPSVNRSWFID
jgi:hypothetical protein